MQILSESKKFRDLAENTCHCKHPLLVVPTSAYSSLSYVYILKSGEIYKHLWQRLILSSSSSNYINASWGSADEQFYRYTDNSCKVIEA